ncbi:MAG: ABC-2 type transport system permease protein [Myxococcota bacterium]
MFAGLLGVLFQPPGSAMGVEILLVDHDDSQQSRALVDALAAAPEIRVRRISSKEQARESVLAGDVAVAVVLPSGAGAGLNASALMTGRRLQAELLVDPTRRLEAELAEGVLNRTVARLMTRELPTGVPVAAASGLVDLTRTPTAGATANYHSYSHTFAGMVCMFLLFFGLENAKGLLAERDRGTLTRLRVIAGPNTILSSLAASTALLALGSSLVVYAIGAALFGIEVRGSGLGLLLVLVAQAAFVGGFTLLVASLGSTERQLTAVGTFAILLMSFLGGAWLPTFLMPDWMQTAASVLPTHWATRGLAGMTWRGLDLTAALAPAAVLATAGLAAGAMGTRLFRWPA